MPLDKAHLNAKKVICLKEMSKEFQISAAKLMTPSSRGKRFTEIMLRSGTVIIPIVL